MVLLFCFSILVLPTIAQSSSTIIAKNGSTPTIDGLVGTSEWSDASTLSFNGTQVFVKQDGNNLYIAFKAPVYVASVMNVYIDVNNDKGSTLQSDDATLSVGNDDTTKESNVVSNAWARTAVSGWTGRSQTASNTIQFEISVTFAKLNVVAGSSRTLGINFGYQTSNNPPALEAIFYWLNTAGLAQPGINPSAWGTMNSTGFNWIPEFPSLLILPLFIVLTLLAVSLFRKTNQKTAAIIPA
jgi:hypothetical protein